MLTQRVRPGIRQPTIYVEHISGWHELVYPSQSAAAPAGRPLLFRLAYIYSPWVNTTTRKIERRSEIYEEKSGTTFYFNLSGLEPNTFGQSTESTEVRLKRKV